MMDLLAFIALTTFLAGLFVILAGIIMDMSGVDFHAVEKTVDNGIGLCAIGGFGAVALVIINTLL